MSGIAGSCRKVLPQAAIVAAALWVVFPIIGQLNSCLPIRSNQITTVPLFNAWTIWWNADRAKHGFADYWQAPIFFPEVSTFAYSEPQPATVIVAPVVWLTGSPTLAYNVYLILSLYLNGFVTFVVLRRHGHRRLISTIGAIMVVWLPLGLDQVEVLQLVPVWPIIWVWDVVRRHGLRPTRWTAIEAALAYTTCFYTCVHHTLFLSLVLVATGWCLFLSFRTKRFWMSSLLALSIAAVLVGIVLIPLRQTLKGESFERTPDLVERLSAQPSNLFRSPPHALIWGATVRGFSLSPGGLKLALAAIGFAIAMCRRRRKSWAIFLLMTAVCSGLLTLGPHLKIGTWQPWWDISERCPGMGQVRNVFRFAYLTQLSVSLLALLGLRELTTRLSVITGKQRLMASLMVVVGVLALIEVPPLQPTLAGAPDLQRHHAWTDFIKQNTPTGKGIACVPFSASSRALDFDSTTRWMYYGTLHGVPMVNGYSGFFPERYMRLRKTITEQGLNDEIMAELVGMNVHFVVIRSGYLMPAWQFGVTRPYFLKQVFHDPVGVYVYEIQPGQ